MAKVMIEAAINGNAAKAQNPNLPYTPEEIAQDAIATCKAGWVVKIRSVLRFIEVPSVKIALKSISSPRSIPRHPRSGSSWRENV